MDPFVHEESSSRAEALYLWQETEGKSRLSAYMADGSTLHLAGAADAFGVSDDGAFVAYGENASGKLWVKPTRGGTPIQVWTSDSPSEFVQFGQIVFSRDGSRVVFRYGSQDTFAAATDGSAESDELGNFQQYVLSPDGNYVVLGNPEPLGSITLRQAELVNLTSGASVAKVGEISSMPLWAADSSAFYFSKQTSGLNSCDCELKRIAAVDGVETIPNGCVRRELAMSPDGTKLTYLKAEGSGSSQSNLYVADLDGENEVEVVGPALDPKGQMVWLPDGSGIIYEDASHAVRRVNPDGSNDIQLATVEGAYGLTGVLLVSPDSSAVAFEDSVGADQETFYIAAANTADSAVAVLADDDRRGYFNPRWAAGEPCLGFFRHPDAGYEGQAFVVGREGECSLLPTGTSRGPVPASFVIDTDASEGISFAGGAVFSRIKQGALTRETSDGTATSVAPESSLEVTAAVTIDRYVGSGSEQAPERVVVQSLTSL